MLASTEESAVSTQLALLVQGVKSLSETVDRNQDEIRGMVADHETRLRKLAEDQAIANGEIGKLKERQGTLAIIQAAFTAVASAVAAVVGRQS